MSGLPPAMYVYFYDTLGGSSERNDPVFEQGYRNTLALCDELNQLGVGLKSLMARHMAGGIVLRWETAQVAMRTSGHWDAPFYVWNTSSSANRPFFNVEDTASHVADVLWPAMRRELIGW